MAFMLQLELASFVESSHHFLGFAGGAAVANILEVRAMHLVSHQLTLVHLRRLGELLDVLVSELVLQTGFFQENGFWLDVEDAVVVFI